MASNSLVRARIDPEIRDKASEVLARFRGPESPVR